MSKVPYTKTALSYADQLQQLKDRGLVIANEPKALHLLEEISYYRLSGYWYPMLTNKQNHQFKHNSNFEIAFNIYKFDRELRLLILYLMNTINPKHKVQAKFNALLAKYPNIDTKAMGFPNNWQTETLWKYK